MAKQRAKKGTLRRVLGYIGVYRYVLLLSVLFAAMTVALTLYLPILAGDAIDQILVGGVRFDALLPILGRIAVVTLCTGGLQWVANVLNNKMAFSVVRDIRNHAVDRLTHLPLSYLDRKPVGEIVSRITTDAEQMADGLLLGFSQLTTGAFTILGALIFMFVLRPSIAVTVLVLTPISLVVASFIAKRTYRMFHRQSELRGKQTALMNEMVTNQKLVKAFVYEDVAQARFDVLNAELEQAAVQATFFASLVNPTTRFVNSIVYAAVGLVGALVAIGGGMTVGLLSYFLSYANQYTKPFNEISGVITEMQNALACADRIFTLLEAEPEQMPAGSPVLTDVAGQVTLSDVSFSYTPEQELLKHVNLSVSPGSHIAIVGPTGCGKTTLINLLMRFYDVDRGVIAVDGTDIRTVTRTSLRESYGMVLQDTWLRAGTVRENITMGKPDATDAEVIAAAKATHAHSFIKRMPKGYDTVIGEDGGGLSAGQKQLLCITRIMLATPPMLILDEATSSIDTRTEQRIQKAFLSMMEGRTAFVVAHRLSTIRNSDCILVMRDGNVVESGTHTELLAANGFYAELHRSRMAAVEE